MEISFERKKTEKRKSTFAFVSASNNHFRDISKSFHVSIFDNL